MRELDLLEMEQIEGGDPVGGAILTACVGVGVALSIGGAFITFGTSLWWGTALTGAFCSGAAVGYAVYNARN